MSRASVIQPGRSKRKTKTNRKNSFVSKFFECQKTSKIRRDLFSEEFRDPGGLWKRLRWRPNWTSVPGRWTPASRWPSTMPRSCQNSRTWTLSTDPSRPCLQGKCYEIQSWLLVIVTWCFTTSHYEYVLPFLSIFLSQYIYAGLHSKSVTRDAASEFRTGVDISYFYLTYFSWISVIVFLT